MLNSCYCHDCFPWNLWTRRGHHTRLYMCQIERSNQKYVSNMITSDPWPTKQISVQIQDMGPTHDIYACHRVGWSINELQLYLTCFYCPNAVPDSNVLGANMGHAWDRHDPSDPMLDPWTLLSGVFMFKLWGWKLLHSASCSPLDYFTIWIYLTFRKYCYKRYVQIILILMRCHWLNYDLWHHQITGIVVLDPKPLAW